MKLSVIIPAYSEAHTIEEVLERVCATPFIDKEIIVVDDGSTDGTRELLAGIKSPYIRVLLHSINQGKGAALKTGFAAERVTSSSCKMQISSTTLATTAHC